VIFSSGVAYRMRSVAGAETPAITYTRTSGTSANGYAGVSIAQRPA
jgi:hypothetical protein